MQLSAFVLSSDPQLSAPVLPGVPASAPAEGAAAFDDLLPNLDATAPAAPGRKATDPLAAAGGEVAASLMMSWLAALTPASSAPTEIPSLDGLSASPAGVDGTNCPGGEGEGSPVTEGRGLAGASAAILAGQPSAFSPITSPCNRAAQAAGSAAVIEPEGTADATATTTEQPASAAIVPASVTSTTASDVTVTESAPLAEAAVTAMADNRTRPSPMGSLRAAKAAMRAELGQSNRWEKIAAADEHFVPGKIPSLDEMEKKILNTDNKDITKQDDGLGIGIAMPRPTMFTSLFSHPQSASAGATSAVAEQAPNPAATASTELASQAHRAMNVILTVADRLNASSRSSVQLQFSVGGADLSIRVELRAGEVHATFRTDSSELRSALAAEWQAVGADASRTTRVADAVFAPASPAGATPFLGDGASQHRESGHRQQAEVIQFPSIHPLNPRTPVETAVPDFRPAAFRPDLNLYTFA